MRFVSCLLLMLIFFSKGKASDKRYEYKWETPAPRVEIPEQFRNEDAVIVSDSSKFSITTHGLYFTQYRRIRIQSSRGIEQYARIAIPVFSSAVIQTLDARTIKKNGAIVDFENADIKKIDLPDESLERTMNFILFSVPAVEVGDEIETIFVMENASPSYQYFLHGELPKLEATYSLSVPNFLIMDLMVYNEMPQPVVKKNIDDVVYKWKMQNLTGTGSQSCSILSLKLPFIIQVIQGLNWGWFQSDETQWRDYANVIIDRAKTDYNRSGKYSNAIETLTSTVNGSLSKDDTVGRISAVHRYINDSMRIVKEVPENAYLSIGKMLEQKQITALKLMYFYVNLFENEGVPYYVVFARERYKGPIDPKVVSLLQVDDIFFAFQKGSKLYFLKPATEDEKYEMNELPVQVQSTFALLAKAKDTLVGKIFLSETTPQDNFRVHKIKAIVDYKQNVLRLEVQEKLNGSLSTLFRHKYLAVEAQKELKEYVKGMMDKRCPSAELDTVYIVKGEGYPQTFRLNYTLLLKDRITQLEENLYSVSLENLFWYYFEDIDVQKRTMDYYPVCSTSEDFKYYLMFDKKVELVNGENLNVNVSYPEIGKYTFSANAVKEDVILLESVYQKGGNKVPAGEIGKLADLNQAVKNVDNEPLLFRIATP